MAGLWNPYEILPPGRRRLLGVGAVSSVLVLWSLLSGTGLVGPNKLPAPWDVMQALAYLSWHDGESLLLTATLWSLGRVLAAAALRCVGGQFKGRLLFRNDDERARARKWGIEDLDKIYDLEELAKGDCIFAATGVTSGSLLEGVKRTAMARSRRKAS